MPSGLCHQCGPKGSRLKSPKDIKKVRMFLEAQQGPDGPREVIIYLCGPCARELGHTTREKTDA